MLDQKLSELEKCSMRIVEWMRDAVRKAAVLWNYVGHELPKLFSVDFPFPGA